MAIRPDHDLRAADETLPGRMLVGGSTGPGDVFRQDLAHVTAEGECPVLCFDHEIDECANQWPSLLAFLGAISRRLCGATSPRLPNL